MLDDKAMQAQTRVFVSQGSVPADRTLKLFAIGDYQASDADRFIDAIVAASRAAAKCEDKEWSNRAKVGGGGIALGDSFIDESYTETFCTMSNYLKIYRYSSEGDGDKHGSIEVGVQEEGDDFDWCGILDFGGQVTGKITKGGSDNFLGIVQVVCDTIVSAKGG